MKVAAGNPNLDKVGQKYRRTLKYVLLLLATNSP